MCFHMNLFIHTYKYSNYFFFSSITKLICTYFLLPSVPMLHFSYIRGEGSQEVSSFFWLYHILI